MTKSDFLYELRRALDVLPSEEIDKTIDYYAEIIDDAVEDGNTENDAVTALGAPADIASKIINETPLQIAKRKLKDKKFSPLTITLLIIGSPLWAALGIALFAVILSIYIGLWSIVISLFSTAFALAVSAFAALIVTFPLMPVRPLKAVFFFGSALLCAGLAVLIFYLAMLCAKLMIKLTRLCFKRR